MKTISWELIKKKVKKRKGWIALGNTLFITGFLSFNNHPDWGVWCSVIGLMVALVSILNK
jgi:hypothetical protein